MELHRGTQRYIYTEENLSFSNKIAVLMVFEVEFNLHIKENMLLGGVVKDIENALFFVNNA